MGIPSYFSFIVKNHGNIVRKIHRLNKNVDNFYLDSNSIVYDCLRALEKEYKRLIILSGKHKAALEKNKKGEIKTIVVTSPEDMFTQ